MQHQQRKYTCHKQFTQDQRQADADYGILQVEDRTLEINYKENKFEFNYHYYYESEQSYQMVKQESNDTIFSGTLQQEGNKFVATIVNGSQEAEDKVKKVTLYSGKNLTGSFEFILEGDSIKIQVVNLQPQEIDRKQCILLANQVYQAIK